MPSLHAVLSATMLALLMLGSAHGILMEYSDLALGKDWVLSAQAPPYSEGLGNQGIGVQDAFPTPRPTGPLNATGPQSLIVIAVEFRDLNHTKSLEEIGEAIFTTMNDYYKEASYGKMLIVGNIVGWYRLNASLADYGTDSRGIDDIDGDWWPDSWRLVRDAVLAADRDVDFSQYRHVMAVHAGHGQETSGRKTDIWSVTYFWGRTVYSEERPISRFSIVPEDGAKGTSPLGVYAHEFGHLLGLQDLYDRGSGSSNVGPWDPMDRGMWNGQSPGSSPAHFTAWSKIRLGWISQEQIAVIGSDASVEVVLDPIELPSSGYQAIKIPVGSTGGATYYLIEVRVQIGFDSALPSSGVLVTYVDERLTSGTVKAVDAEPSTRTLDDATFSVGQAFTDLRNAIGAVIIGTSGSSYVVSVVRGKDNALADIRVDPIRTDPVDVRPGDDVIIYVKLVNQGLRDAEGFQVTLYIDEAIYSDVKVSLRPGQSAQLTFRWKAVGGNHTLRVAADPQNSLSELTELNNEATLKLVVGYQLTLGFSSDIPSSNVTVLVRINGVQYTLTGQPLQLTLTGGSQTIEVQAIVDISVGVRLIFLKWSDGDRSNPRTVNLLSDLTLVAVYGTQYYLKVNGNGGQVTGGGWYDKGVLANATAITPSNVVERRSRLVFTHWSGDVNSTSPEVSILMDAPHSIAANWKTQFYLQVESPYGSPTGEGWYDVNTEASVSIVSIVDHGNGTRRVFSSWGGDSTSHSTDITILMDAPKRVEAVWKTQHFLSVVSTLGEPKGTGWYDEGFEAKFSVNSPVEYGNGTRWVFIGWSGDYSGRSTEGSVVMSSPRTVAAQWRKQYKVTFAARGLPDSATATFAVNGERKTTITPNPYTGWYDADSEIYFDANATVRVGSWHYNLLRWENSTGGAVSSPQILRGPETYTAIYVRGMLPLCVVATAAFGSELDPHVEFLRRFRDERVMTTLAGKSFMEAFNAFYYSFSPALAALVSENEGLRTVVRYLLYPLIGVLRVAEWSYMSAGAPAEVSVVVAGLVASSLIGLVYIAPALSPALLKSKRLRKHVLQARLIAGLSFTWAASLGALILGELLYRPTLTSASASTLVLTNMILTCLILLKPLLSRR